MTIPRCRHCHSYMEPEHFSDETATSRRNDCMIAMRSAEDKERVWMAHRKAGIVRAFPTTFCIGSLFEEWDRCPLYEP